MYPGEGKYGVRDGAIVNRLFFQGLANHKEFGSVEGAATQNMTRS